MGTKKTRQYINLPKTGIGPNLGQRSLQEKGTNGYEKKIIKNGKKIILVLF